MRLSDKKNINAILFFALKSAQKKINRLKLMKLLWLADRIHLNKYGRLILKDTYCALPNGPVPSESLNFSKCDQPGRFSVVKYTIHAEAECDSSFFSKSDIEVLEQVWTLYGKKNQFELRDISHQFPEWKRFEDDLKNPHSLNSYNIIIDDFFEIPENNKYPYNKEETQKSRAAFHIHSRIQSYFST